MKKIIISIITFSFILLLLVPLTSFAVDPSNKSPEVKTTNNETSTITPKASTQPTGYAGDKDVLPTIDSPVKATSIPQLINRVIRILFLLIAMVATIMIVYSGIQLVTSQGSDAVVKTAKSRITWSLIGLVVALMSYAIVGIIYNLV